MEKNCRAEAPGVFKRRHLKGQKGKDPVDKLYLCNNLGQDVSALPSSGIRKIELGQVLSCLAHKRQLDMQVILIPLIGS